VFRRGSKEIRQNNGWVACKKKGGKKNKIDTDGGRHLSEGAPEDVLCDKRQGRRRVEKLMLLWMVPLGCQRARQNAVGQGVAAREQEMERVDGLKANQGAEIR